MTKRVLFVDEDPYLLKALKRSFRDMRDTWQIVYAGSGAEALKTLVKTPADVVLTGLRMSDMDGPTLLKCVMKLRPEAVRIVISGHTDHNMLLDSAGIAHQFITKPWKDDQVREAIQRAFVIQDILDKSGPKSVIAKITALPSLPSLYVQLVDELESGDASIDRVAEIVSQDPGMTAKILQLANSAFFCRLVTIADPVKAVGILGLDTIEAVTLTAGLIQKLDPRKLNGFPVDALWGHSLQTGQYVKQIGRLMDADKALQDSAYLAALLHDIGKLLLAYYFPGQQQTYDALIEKGGICAREAEISAFGASHEDVGAYLLGLWGLPLPVVEAVRFHHRPMRCTSPGLEPLTLVHCANALLLALEPVAANGCHPADDLDYDYLAALDLTGQLDDWRMLASSVCA